MTFDELMQMAIDADRLGGHAAPREWIDQRTAIGYSINIDLCGNDPKGVWVTRFNRVCIGVLHHQRNHFHKAASIHACKTVCNMSNRGAINIRTACQLIELFAYEKGHQWELVNNYITRDYLSPASK